MGIEPMTTGTTSNQELLWRSLILQLPLDETVLYQIKLREVGVLQVSFEQLKFV